MKDFENVFANFSANVSARLFNGKMKLSGVVLLLAAVLTLAPVTLYGLPLTSMSEDAPGDAAAGGGNARAVRLSSVDGQVKIVQDGQVIADPATANLPLFEGTQVMTGEDGRAEVQLDDGNLVRVSPNSTVTLSVLQTEGTGTKTDVVVNRGLAYFELQPSTAEHNMRVSYGQSSFSASSFTIARVTMDAAPGELAVFSGNVHLDRGEVLQVDVHGGESLSLDPSDVSKYNVAETIEQDSWDSWNADRDQLLNSESADKTAATAAMNGNQTPGMSDLDANGNWYNVPGQGYVWSPYDAQNAGSSWDPYGYGSWVSYPGYGYIWASGYGWGYAPYQCGLWNFYDNFGWGWAPGNGCSPWYGGYGGYGGGWGYNIGNYPRGYKPPRRPPGPIHPIPRGGNSGGLRSITTGAKPVIPVDRRPAGSNILLAGERTGEPVTIAGHSVEPLKPVAPRQSYGGTSASFVNGGSGGSVRPGGVYVPSGSRPGTYPTGQPGYRPTQPGYVPSRTAPVQGARPAAPTNMGGGGARSAPSAPSMPSGGGGGHAGGGAPSGGGGTHR